MQAIGVNSFGGPEAFTVVEADRPTPAATQVLVELSVAASNYLDVYQRSGVVGLFPGCRRTWPGSTALVGSEVTDLREGQRVGWLSGGQGSFADYVAG